MNLLQHPWRMTGVLAILAGIVCTVIFLLEHFYVFPDHKGCTAFRRTREVQVRSDFCLSNWGGIEINYTLGETTFQFDLCEVITCGGQQANWKGYDLYLCLTATNQKRCIHKTYDPTGWCPGWILVIAYTGPRWTPDYSANDVPNLRAKGSRISLQRGQWSRDGEGTNPVMLSIGRVTQGFFTKEFSSDKIIYLTLGAEISGKDPHGIIRINLLQPHPSQTETLNKTTSDLSEQKGPVITFDYSKLKPTDLVHMATGYSSSNLWLDWMAATAQEQHISD